MPLSAETPAPVRMTMLLISLISPLYPLASREVET
jgi:hypothetical protein